MKLLIYVCILYIAGTDDNYNPCCKGEDFEAHSSRQSKTRI